MYSRYSPKIKINKNVKEFIIIYGLKLEEIVISGRRRPISISKIKKIRLITKNWLLKGNRALEDGLNPHSKGDIFSWLIKDFFEI